MREVIQHSGRDARDGLGTAIRLADGETKQRPAEVLVRSATVYVVFVAWVLAVLGVAAAVWAMNDLAEEHRSLSPSERLHGDWRYQVVPDRRVLDDALSFIPVDGSYRVVVGPMWRSRFRSPWTTSLERDLMTFVLYPRRVTTSRDAEWVLCMGCDASAVGRLGEVVSGGRRTQLIRVGQ